MKKANKPIDFLPALTEQQIISLKPIGIKAREIHIKQSILLKNINK